MTRPRRATIADVARRAGVSPTAVSFVLNDVPDAGIAAATQRRIRAAAAELGYRPNAAAKLLRTRRSHTIGFVTDQIASTPFAVDTIRGAQDAAWEDGKLLLIVDTGRNEAIAASAIDAMLERRVEGLIYAAMYHQVVDLRLPTGEVPTVLLDCVAADRSVASVVPDEVGGGRAATEALLRAGHRRIGFVNVRAPIPAGIGRLAGYRAALGAAGVPFDGELVRLMGEDPVGEGERCARELLGLADPPTALFCWNDQTAMGAYAALRDLGLRVPADVAVVGFDNQEIIAANLRPPLSTVALPHYEMGRWAVRYLARAAEREEPEPVQHVLPCPYVARGSV